MGSQPQYKKFPFDFMECVESWPNGAALRTFGDTFWTQQLSYHSASAGANGQVEYIGFTNPGNGISASAWAIKRLMYDSSGNISAIAWASGSLAMTRMWADRTTYTYS